MNEILAIIRETCPEPYASRAVAKIEALDPRRQILNLAANYPELAARLQSDHPELFAALAGLQAPPAAAAEKPTAPAEAAEKPTAPAATPATKTETRPPAEPEAPTAAPADAPAGAAESAPETKATPKRPTVPKL